MRVNTFLPISKQLSSPLSPIQKKCYANIKRKWIFLLSVLAHNINISIVIQTRCMKLIPNRINNGAT